MPEKKIPTLLIAAHQLKTEITYIMIKEILAPLGIDVLVLKGPHLGATVYESPKDRLYGDLDLLVKPQHFQAAAEALLANGFKPEAYKQFAIEVQEDFKHWEYKSPQGIIVELHRWLSGHDRYPLDLEGMFARAEKFVFGETEAWGLSTEDLLLHLCLHMGTSYFLVIEPKHIQDIALLTRKRGVDWADFMKRVKKAGARTVAYYALSSARRQQDAEIPDVVLHGLCPGFIRRRWIEKFINAGRFPICGIPAQGIGRLKRSLLLPFMDTPKQWYKFIIRSIHGRIKHRFR